MKTIKVSAIEQVREAFPNEDLFYVAWSFACALALHVMLREELPKEDATAAANAAELLQARLSFVHNGVFEKNERGWTTKLYVQGNGKFFYFALGKPLLSVVAQYCLDHVEKDRQEEELVYDDDVLDEEVTEWVFPDEAPCQSEIATVKAPLKEEEAVTDCGQDDDTVDDDTINDDAFENESEVDSAVEPVESLIEELFDEDCLTEPDKKDEWGRCEREQAASADSDEEYKNEVVIDEDYETVEPEEEAAENDCQKDDDSQSDSDEGVGCEDQELIDLPSVVLVEEAASEEEDAGALDSEPAKDAVVELANERVRVVATLSSGRIETIAELRAELDGLSAELPVFLFVNNYWENVYASDDPCWNGSDVCYLNDNTATIERNRKLATVGELLDAVRDRADDCEFYCYDSHLGFGSFSKGVVTAIEECELFKVAPKGEKLIFRLIDQSDL